MESPGLAGKGTARPRRYETDRSTTEAQRGANRAGGQPSSALSGVSQLHFFAPRLSVKDDPQLRGE
jgi:hypothetical protein